MHSSGNKDDVAPPESELPTIHMLIDQYHDSVYRYSFRLVGRQADAEDVTQQTFLIATQKLDQLKEPSSAKSWLLTIARNCFLKRLRRKTALTASEIDIDVGSVEAAQQPAAPDEEIGLEALHKAVQQLEDNHRLVITMYYFEKLSYREIAAQLRVPVGTIMSRLSRAKSKLRNVLKRTSANAGRYSE